MWVGERPWKIQDQWPEAAVTSVQQSAPHRGVLDQERHQARRINFSKSWFRSPLRSGLDVRYRYATGFTTGAFQRPSSASDFGMYRCMITETGPFGVGSQFASASLPGDSF
jgi:hypothetical protein